MPWVQIRPTTVTRTAGTKEYRCEKCKCIEFLVYRDSEGTYIECTECYAQTDEPLKEEVKDGKD